MSSAQDRVTAKIESAVDRGPVIEFTYEHPFARVESAPQTAEHNPIDHPTVVQHLGPSARSITFDGTCYIDEANKIDRLRFDERVSVRHERFGGEAIVTRATTDPTGSGGGERPSGGGGPNDNLSPAETRLYTYTIEMTELLSGGNQGGGGG